MKTKMFVALSVLLIVSLACGATSQPQPGTGPQATELPQGVATQPPVELTTESPNLELTTYVASTEDIGNGMKRLTFTIASGKNASQGWYSYSLIQTLGGWGSKCVWLTQGAPTLETNEGYTYTAITDYQLDCGPRYIVLSDPLPPGAKFTWYGEDIQNNLGSWGWVQFDIPQNATPKNITYPYAAFDVDWNYTPSSVTVPTTSEATNLGQIIDPKYGQKVYKPGDELNFGSIAAMNFQVGTEQQDGTRTVTMNINNLDQGYPIDLDWHSSTYLLYQDGALCCDAAMEQWGWTTSLYPGQGTIIGPSQSGLLQTNVNMRGGSVWIIVKITIKEAIQNGQEESKVFVLEIP